MLKLGSLSLPALQERLAEGLILRTGPFSFRIRSHQHQVAAGLALLYTDFPIVDEPGFVDFHVELGLVTGLRRWIRPQVNFWLDGYSPFKPLPADHAFAMLEWGMNWCMVGRAHHYLMLHAAVLERRGACVIMPGEPGAGKSTLTAALMLSGWRLLSDELTLVDRDDGRIAALARPVSLKNASIDIIRRFDSQAILGESAYDTHKGTVAHLRPGADSVAQIDSKGRAAHIVFPKWQADANGAQLRPRAKADAFVLLANNAFNYSVLGRRGFELNAGLIDGSDCWDFSYSQLDDALCAFEGLCK
ncbi:HprK-related kinase A [soil metagenome]